MRRRRFLGLVASTGVMGGCTGLREEPPVDGTLTPAPVPTATGGGPPAVTAAMLQPGIVVPGDGFISVVDEAGQYLAVDVEGTAPEKSAVEFRFDGRSYAPAALGRGLYRAGSQGPLYDADGGTLVFALPETGDGTDAELVWPNGSWAPSQTVVARLEDPLPPFCVSLDGPETATVGDEPQLTVSVTNDGEGAGRYVLALNRIGPRIAFTPVTRISGELSAGESERRTIEAVPPEGDRSTQYRLAVPGRRAGPSHAIQPSE